MKDLGELLKNKRLEKGIELQEISDITKISVRYLEGIEKGDWSMMPGTFYVKGFIRSYAKSLNFDVSSHLEEIDSEMKQDQISSTTISSTTYKPVKANRFGKLFALSLVVILIIVVAAFIVHYVSNVEPEPLDSPQLDSIHKDDDTSTGNVSEFETLPEKEQPMNEPEITEEISIQFIEQQQNTFIYEVIGAKEIEIRIEAVLGDCWYEIRSANQQGNVITTNTLRNGNEDITSNDNSTWLSLGNPRAVNLYVNGQKIEIQDTGQSLRFQFNIVNQ